MDNIKYQTLNLRCLKVLKDWSRVCKVYLSITNRLIYNAMSNITYLNILKNYASKLITIEVKLKEVASSYKLSLFVLLVGP